MIGDEPTSNFEFYQQALGDLPGIQFCPNNRLPVTRWLTASPSIPTIGGDAART